MGSDEHGPAYPEPNDSVPVVLSPGECSLDGGRTWWLSETYPTQDELRKRSPAVPTMIVGWALVLALCAWAFWPRSAPAMDHGFNPNDTTVKWMESLKRPNIPEGSCCGKGDGYPVSDYFDNHNGTWTAVIGDGSAITYPDGTTRNYIATGEKVIVPDILVNKIEDDIDNPTDTSWIFMTVRAAEVGTVYCLIRHPQDN